MSLYKTKGNFQNEVIDPDKLSEEWTSAQRIVDNATSWQFLGAPNSGLEYSELAEAGAGVSVSQKQKSGYIAAGLEANFDGPYLTKDNHGVSGYKPWLIPYLKGYQEVWDGDLAVTWTSTTIELVLIGYSLWTYRLSSSAENTNNLLGSYYEIEDKTWWESLFSPGLSTTPENQPGTSTYPASDFFGEETRIRTRLGLKLDGLIVDGSGPGTNVATNAPEMRFGAGSREKGIVTSSQSLHMVGAGTHRVSPVAGQGPSSVRNLYNFYETEKLRYTDNTAEHQENLGVAVVNARIHVIRFPRGKMLGD